MLTEAAARERSGDEAGARAAVGLQKSVWRRVIGFIGGLLGFISGLVGLIVVAVRVTKVQSAPSLMVFYTSYYLWT